MEEHVHGFAPGHCQHGLFPELATSNFPLFQTRSYQVRDSFLPTVRRLQCRVLHASHRSRRKHPQRYNETNSLVTSTTSCTNLLHTRTIQCKEFVLRSLKPRLLRLTSKHHCRIDMQTEQWSSLWTYQFPHKLPHQTNRAPHVLARMH